MIHKVKYWDVLHRSSSMEGGGVRDVFGVSPTDNNDAKVVLGLWYL